MLDPRLVALAVCICLEALFCRVIYSQKKSNWEDYHVYLLFYVLFGLLWALGAGLTLFASSILLVNIGLTMFTLTPMVATFFIVIYSYAFAGLKIKRPVLTATLGVIPIAIASGLCGFDLSIIYNVNSIQPSSGLNDITVNRLPYIIYSAYFVILFQIAYLAHMKAIRKSEDPELKRKVIYSFCAIMAVGLIGMASNLLTPSLSGSLEIIWLGPLVGLIFVATSTFAIVKHRLFDVRSSAFRALGYSLSVATLVGIYSVVIYGILLPIIFPGTEFTTTSFLLITVGTATTVLIFDKVRVVFDSITDRLFFKNSYNLPRFLDEFNQALINSSDVGDLAASIFKVMGDNIKTEFFVLVVKHGSFEITIDSRKQESLREADAKVPLSLINYHFKNRNRVVLTDFMNKDKYEGLYHSLKEVDAAAAIDLSEGSKTTSSLKKALESGDFKAMFLGPKRSGESYNAQDLDALRIISKELVVGLQNAMRFEEIKLFNLELQHKVDLATGKLRDQNKKLILADELKDDFLSIASHQMRTPISAINGYASILNSGDAGKLNKNQQKFAKIIEESTKKLSYLINDFLTVSRLKSGKFSIEKSVTNLKTLLKGEVEGLKTQFKSKDIRLKVSIDENLPEVKADESKMRQVMMNLIDNALYYTPSGGEVDVSLKKTGQGIVFEVRDSGIGVPKEDQAKLFSKMYRASNAQKMRPDGTGLGLYLAKKVILGHHGHIIFKSTEGQGSTFGFRIPVK